MELSKEFWNIVKSQIDGNRKHGWGKDDSMAVVETLIMADHAVITKNKAASVELLFFIDKVVNPSAFRLVLESKAVALLDKQESKKGKVDGWMAGLTDDADDKAE